MTRLLRALRPFLTAALLLAPAPLLAQDDCTIGIASKADLPSYSRPDDPWIYRGTDIPIDGEWLMGELPNGLRYAVRQNGAPPCQVAIRVQIDAGSLHEEESERGFAHLIEHLTFRESRALGPGEAIPLFQRWGAAFGLDTNATTSATQTVYQLDLPDIGRDRLEEAMRLFSGMIEAPALSADNLAADVPIVLAERRERAGPDMRIALALNELLYTGQRLANRSPIGTVETLQAATPQAVQAFHRRWYRPDNAVVVLVGDASPQVLAAVVERNFGDWYVAGPDTPEPDFGTPQAPRGTDPANPVGEVAVYVEPGQARGLTFSVLRPWVQIVDNMEYNRGLLVDAVARAIINRRLEENARAGGSYLQAGVAQEDVSRTVDGTFVTLTPLTDDWQAALADVRAVIADALVTPPTPEEIAQVVAQFELSFADMVEQERSQAGPMLADNLVNAIDIREAVAAPGTFQAMFRSMETRFTPQAILDHTRSQFSGNVVRAFLLTPQAGEATAEQLRAAMLAPPPPAPLARAAGPALNFADLPPIGIPSLPSLREPLGPGLLSTTERIVFPNGVQAMIRDSSNEPGRVTVQVRFGAGRSGFAADEAVYANLGAAALVSAGVGTLGPNELDRITAGRKMSFGFAMDEGSFTFTGDTRAEDLADQLYLFAAKLATPRWDVAVVERAKASALLGYDALDGDPMGVLARDLDALLRNGDPRYATPTPDQLRAATASDFRQVWQRLLSQGEVEVSVFGDIDPEATVEALGRTFGALPPRQPLGPAADRPALDFPASNAVPQVLRHDGDADQAAALVAWSTGGGSPGLPQARKLEVLAQLISNRLLDGLREDAGSAYTPFASSNWPLDLDRGGYLLALVQLAPADVGTVFTEVDAIVADLAQNGPSDDELARVIEPMRQYIMRAQNSHAFWQNELAGGLYDPYRLGHLPTLATDYVFTSREEIQALAQRYLVGHGGFRLAVLPQEAPAPSR